MAKVAQVVRGRGFGGASSSSCCTLRGAKRPSAPSRSFGLRGTVKPKKTLAGGVRRTTPRRGGGFKR